MRGVRLLLGILLVACSTTTAVFYFLPHSTARMRQIFEYGYYQYLLWGFPPAVCIFASFVLGVWLAASAFRSVEHRETRAEANI